MPGYRRRGTHCKVNPSPNFIPLPEFMKKLLLIIPLLFGCAREYECDVGYIDADGEFHSIGGPGTDTQFQASATLDWPDGEKEAEERCENTYNEIATEEEVTRNIICRCEKAN